MVVIQAGRGSRKDKASLGRYQEGHGQKTQERIVETASRLFREQGVHATGLAQIMKESGLTVGGFYKHFESKNELLKRALEHALSSFQPSMSEVNSADPNQDWLALFADFYLHPAHVANPGRGCPLPSLLSEISRGPLELRQSCEGSLLSMLNSLETWIPGEAWADKREMAWGILATLVGAMVLARSVASAELRDEILRGARGTVALRIRASGDLEK